MTKEMGKPITESEDEIAWFSGEASWFSKEGKKYLHNENNDVGIPEVTSHIEYNPIGVVGVISPWNFPLETPMWAIVPALLAGNSVVWKPSTLVQLFSKRVYEIASEVFPKNVLTITLGDSNTGKFLVDSEINMLAFTGSTRVGKEITSVLGGKLKKAVTELGGSDPFIVLKDVDIDFAVKGAVLGRFYNCGQSCTAAKRFYIAHEIFDDFTDKFVEETKSLKIGDPLDKDTKIGPLVSKQQSVLLKNQIVKSSKMGAKILLGGSEKKCKGYFYKPTIMKNIDNKMPVIKEETFGPVAPLISVKNIEEAIKLSNDSQYGLGASIWTKDKKKAEKIARHIQSGIVWINDVNIAYPQCPWGGVKDSGIGRELSVHGIREFTNIKSVIIK